MAVNRTAMNGRRMVTILAIVALAILLVVIEGRRRAASRALAELAGRADAAGADDALGRAEAARVLARLRAVYDLPAEPEPTVALVVDAEKLRAKHAFYGSARNGDYLVLTPTRAILFRSEEKMVVEVMPVSVTPPSE